MTDREGKVINFYWLSFDQKKIVFLIIVLRIRRRVGRAPHQRGIQNMEKEHALPVRSRHDSRA